MDYSEFIWLGVETSGGMFLARQCPGCLQCGELLEYLSICQRFKQDYAVRGW
jgi:hypothetical protein